MDATPASALNVRIAEQFLYEHEQPTLMPLCAYMAYSDLSHGGKRARRRSLREQWRKAGTCLMCRYKELKLKLEEAEASKGSVVFGNVKLSE